jgi:hypothetical protein
LELDGVEDEANMLTGFLKSHPLLEKLALIESQHYHEGIPVELSLEPDSLPALRSFTGSLRTCNMILSALSPFITSLEVVREVSTDIYDPVVAADDDQALNDLFANVSRFHTIHTFELGSAFNFSGIYLGHTLAASLPNVQNLSLGDEFEGNLVRHEITRIENSHRFSSQDDFTSAISAFEHLRRLSAVTVNAVIAAYTSEEGEYRGEAPSFTEVVEAAARVCPFLLEVLRDVERQIPGAVIWRDGHGGVEVRLLERLRSRPIVEYESETDEETAKYYNYDGDDIDDDDD